MILYLASPHTFLNFKGGYELAMKIFLAGAYSRPWLLETAMENYGGVLQYDKKTLSKPYILESFYYCLKAQEQMETLIPHFGDFLLDSGAFTFMQNSKSHLNWDEYIDMYCDFINRNKIQKFFELDIDSVVGYDKVKEYRKTIEQKTGKQVIPVWHKSRGVKDYLRMCEKYDYIAIGGIVSKEIKPAHYPLFTNLIAEAHKRGTKVHGLGFTSLIGITKYPFDSVDSTAWTTGNRFGYLYKFNGETMVKINAPKGKRLKGVEAALNNYTEWMKFQKWAEKNL